MEATNFLEVANRRKLLYAKRAVYTRLQELLESDKGLSLIGLADIPTDAVIDVLADLDSHCMASILSEIDNIEESSVVPPQKVKKVQSEPEIKKRSKQAAKETKSAGKKKVGSKTKKRSRGD